MIMQKENEFLTAALSYIDKGFHVLPLKPNGKAPITRHGAKDASICKKQVRSWWSKYPNANIGIATGKISGIFVVDVDGEYPKHWPAMPDTLTAKTGIGTHYYFEYPEGAAIGNKVKINGYDVDIRGDGGYVVAPPSIHSNGSEYEFLSE